MRPLCSPEPEPSDYYIFQFMAHDLLLPVTQIFFSIGTKFSINNKLSNKTVKILLKSSNCHCQNTLFVFAFLIVFLNYFLTTELQC